MFRHSPLQARALWVQALRSGEYDQGYEMLCDTKDGKRSFCCLGVLCDLFTKLEPQAVAAKQFEVAELVGKVSYDGNDSCLPDLVMEWAGLATGTGLYKWTDDDGDHATDLTEDNDGGKTFRQIADIIEAHEDTLCKPVIFNR
jgi:hypothetical protein